MCLSNLFNNNSCTWAWILFIIGILLLLEGDCGNGYDYGRSGNGRNGCGCNGCGCNDCGCNGFGNDCGCNNFGNDCGCGCR